MRPRRPRSALVAALSGLLVLGSLLPAAAVNDDHGSRVVSAVPADHTPHVMDGAVLGITQVGNRIVVVGDFTSVSPADSFWDETDDIDRHGIFAFDATTGAIDPGFDPDLGAGGAANSIDTDGTHLYVGGSFRSVGGDAAHRRVAKLTSAGAAVPGFRAIPSSRVNDVVVRGSRLYIGGRFTSVASGGTTWPRGALAALDTGTGAVLGGVNLPFRGLWNPDNRNDGGTTAIVRFDVSADGSRLAAVGNFTQVAGRPRQQVAVLNTAASPATVAGWSTNRFDLSRNACHPVFDTFTRDVDFSPDGSWFVVSTTGAFSGGAREGTLCDTLSRWETRGRQNNPTWVDYTGGDTSYGVAVTGSAVYVGGHMRYLNNPFQADQAGPGAVPRQGIAALDPENGLPLSWNPGRRRGVGAQALFATDRGLWVGSDTRQFAGEWHGRLAFLPLAGGAAVPAVPAATLPSDAFAAQPWNGGVLKRRKLGSSGSPQGRFRTVNAGINWAKMRGGFLVNGTLYHGWRNGRLFKRSFDPGTGALGRRSRVDLRDDPDTGVPIPFPVARVSGMTYDAAQHRIYYTVRGHRRLYYRYFTPESEVVGAQTFRASRRGVGFAYARGLTLASGKLLFGSQSGKLRRVRFSGGRVRSKARVVGTSGWNVRGIFTPGG